MDSSRRGIWSLTEKGTQTDLEAFDPYAVFQMVQKGLQAEKKKKEMEEPFIDERDETSADAADYKSELLVRLSHCRQAALNAYARGFFANRAFKRSSLPGELAMAALTELVSSKSIPS